MAAKRKDSKGRVLRKGEGQRSDGRYMFRYTDLCGESRVEYSWRLVETDPYPKEKHKDLSLREKEALIEQDRHDLISTSHGNMTVNELFDFYVKMKKKRGKITVRTEENYTKIWNKNMRSRKFANMQIRAVRKTHILDCYQEMLEDGVGNGSITLMHKVLSAMFNHALSEDYIRRNYAHGCTKELGIYNNKRDALTQLQQEKFLKFISESSEYNAYYWMFEFFFETGARCGETIGLTWQNVDFKNKFVKIDHQLLYELDEEGKRRFQICPPKTIKGIRKIPLTSKVLHALRKQKEYMLKHGMIDNHTVDGHSNLAITMKVYNHVDDKRMRDEIEKFDKKRSRDSRAS